MIEIQQEDHSGWRVLKVSGRADAEAADQLENDLVAAASQHGRVALDLSGLTYISSAGLRSILQAARAAQGHQAEFAVCSPSVSVKKVFDMSGMHQILRIEEKLPC